MAGVPNPHSARRPPCQNPLSPSPPPPSPHPPTSPLPHFLSVLFSSLIFFFHLRSGVSQQLLCPPTPNPPPRPPAPTPTPTPGRARGVWAKSVTADRILPWKSFERRWLLIFSQGSLICSPAPLLMRPAAGVSVTQSPAPTRRGTPPRLPTAPLPSLHFPNLNKVSTSPAEEREQNSLCSYGQSPHVKP